MCAPASVMLHLKERSVGWGGGVIMQPQTCSVGLKTRPQDVICGFRTGLLRMHLLHSSVHNRLRLKPDLRHLHSNLQQGTKKQVTARLIVFDMAV